MSTGTYLYPWDVVGDPAAAERTAALGVEEVALAAAYHSTRALTPRHPQHRVVVAPHAAIYFPRDPRAWEGALLQPAVADWVSGTDPFGAASAALHAAGLTVSAWAVIAHNTALGDRYPETAVVNAFGDRYPWALCIANRHVREYAVILAGEIAARPDVDGIELEACGWYGFDHQSPHDKSAGVRLGAPQQFLFSLCFCPACADEYAADGLDPARLRAHIRDRLDDVFAGRTDAAVDTDTDQWADVVQLLGAETAAAVSKMRRRVSDRLRADVADRIRSVRGPAFPVLLHVSPQPHACGANVGVDPVTAYEHADGLVVNCWRDPDAADSALAALAEAAGQRRVVASFLAVAGMGGDVEGLDERIARARKHGATDLRFYHAGLASAADLHRVTAAAAADRERRPQ